MPEAMKMSEAKKIQEAVEKVREILAFPDKNPFQEYWRKDHRYSLIAQPFHTLSSENVHPYSLPDAWGRNDERQPRSPGDHAQGSRGRTRPLPQRGVVFHPSPGLGKPRPDGTTPRPERRRPLRGRLQMGGPGPRHQPEGHGPVRDRPQMGRPHGRRPDGRQPLQRRPTLRQPDGSQPAGRGPERSHPQPDKPDPGGPDWGQHGRGQPTHSA